MHRIFIVLVSLFMAAPAVAGELDPATKAAIQKTQELLRSQALRNEALKNAPAKAADQKVSDLARSPENIDAIYSLAADLFGDLMTKSGGDLAKVTEILEAGKNDPEGFAKRWSPKQLAELHKIAEQIQSSVPMN